MPFYPEETDEKGNVPYRLHTKGEKYVIDYTNMTLADIQEMDLDIYLFLLREAYIYTLSQTKEGREYLQKCWIFTQTEPDRGGLRARFGKGG